MVTTPHCVSLNSMTLKEGTELDTSAAATAAGQLPSTHTPRGCHLLRPNSHRVAQLSTPRDTKKTWWTSYSPRLVWGNQETIKPLNPATLQYTATDRMKELAIPKPNLRITNNFIPEYQYSCGRESQIWRLTHSSLKAVPSERTQQLARHKTAPPGFVPYIMLNCGRSSPIWRPSTAAINSKPRPRTAELAQPKALHQDYQPPRPVVTVVSSAAKQYQCTSYTQDLAKPKVRPDGPFRDSQWPVSKGALQAEASQRLNELARSKRFAEGYEPCRDVIWRVTTGAKSAVASSRLSELSKPIVRDTMDRVQFNPDAFLVSAAAKKYRATPRIEELAQPIQR